MQNGLSLKVGGFGGVSTTEPAAYGTQDSYDSVTNAAFGPGATVKSPGGLSSVSPTKPVGTALWVGVAAIAALVFIRYSLPN